MLTSRSILVIVHVARQTRQRLAETRLNRSFARASCMLVHSHPHPPSSSLTVLDPRVDCIILFRSAAATASYCQCQSGPFYPINPHHIPTKVIRAVKFSTFDIYDCRNHHYEHLYFTKTGSTIYTIKQGLN